MTGYGHGERVHGDWRLTAELSSVNRKQADVALSVPAKLANLESDVRARIKDRVSRGRVQARVSIESSEGASSALHFDESLAAAYIGHLKKLGDRMGGADATPADLLRAPGVFTLEESTPDPEGLKEPVLAAVDAALDSLVSMQEAEGAHLREDFESRLGELSSIADAIEAKAPGVVEHYRSSLHQRLGQAEVGIDLDDERLIREVALFAERCDISEELTRLRSHFGQFRQYIEGDEAAGRPLDFLCQELNREFNTIGSKANDAELAQLVVRAKTELEKVREQVQNVQ